MQGCWELDGKERRTEFEQGRQTHGTGQQVEENNKM
jgi:hypothetical protein